MPFSSLALVHLRSGRLVPLAAPGLLCAALHAGAVPVVVTVADVQGAPAADAVVSIHVRGTAAATSGKTADLTQRQRRFEPAVLAIQQGTAVNFPNLDTVRHHVYSFSPAKTFEIKLYAATPAAPVVFDKPGTAVLGCNIHDQMLAHVRVVDTPYFARTDTQGRAEIDVPAGSHTMKVWHASLGVETEPAAQPLAVGAAGLKLQTRLGSP
jgi:plastocyanin